MKKTNKNNLIKSVLNKITPVDGSVILFFKFLLVILIVFFMVQFSLVRAADEVEETKDDIDKQEDELKDLEKDANKIQSEIEVVDQAILSTQAVIQKTNQTIEQYESEIKEKEKKIKTKEENIKFKQEILAEYLRLFRRNSLEIGLITFDFNRDLGDYLREVESFEGFQSKIKEALSAIEKEKEEVVEEKVKVEEKKDEKEVALETQEEQKQHLVYQENQKQAVLARTKSSISEVKSKISKLKTELSALLGEGYDTDDIKDAIKYANKKTGVSKGFLFGMLSMESGLGRYTGGCYYKESNMNDTRKKYFKEICKDLDYNYKKKKVSCPPSGYSGTGGAMGVAQFMPDTWAGWKSRIASATGKNPPDPWDLFDGVMAMALKLEEDGAAEDGRVRIINPCDRDEKIKVDWEDYAAMKYLGWSCYALTNYAPGIQNLKDGYDDL